MIFARDHGSVPRKPQVPYLAVADALRERLDAGEWLPGEQMPSATELAAHYGVSRTTAARAVRVLADEGRVTVVRNWGAFVAER
jgi:DNA-binding GntR family transcriptional regulator